ncbi:hypothetical protein ACZ90_09610 [Streptomyces albus subsp. albus]|nr:hypothetical protein ACZ90_09610 [Streptomyces albus subsp. albus]
MLHFVKDTDDPWQAAARPREALVPGSRQVPTHASVDGGPRKPEESREVQVVYRRRGTPLTMLTRRGTAPSCRGFEPVRPGPAAPPHRRPGGSGGAPGQNPVVYRGFAGVGRKI